MLILRRRQRGGGEEEAVVVVMKEGIVFVRLLEDEINKFKAPFFPQSIGISEVLGFPTE